MHCHACSDYVPEGLHLTHCPSCNAILKNPDPRVSKTSNVSPSVVPADDVPRNAPPVPNPVAPYSVAAQFTLFNIAIALTVMFAILKLVINITIGVAINAVLLSTNNPFKYGFQGLLGPLFFTLLAFMVVEIGGILRHENLTKKSVGFFLFIHLMLSAFLSELGQLIIPSYFHITSAPIKKNKYFLNNSQDKWVMFSSPWLMLIIMIALISYLHSFIVLTTPSKSLLPFTETKGLIHFMFFPAYWIKFGTIVLLSGFLAIHFISLKRYTMSTFFILCFVSAFFVNIAGAKIYWNIAYQRLYSKMHALAIEDIMKEYDRYHPLAKVVALDILRNAGDSKAAQFVQQREK